MGCICGQNQIFMDGDKISAILDMPEPKRTQSEVRSFLGAVGFYRKWLSNYSEMAAPLVELLSGKEITINIDTINTIDTIDTMTVGIGINSQVTYDM